MEEKNNFTKEEVQQERGKVCVVEGMDAWNIDWVGGDKLSVLHMKMERKSDCVRSLRWMENGILIRNTDSETSLSLLPRSVMQSWL